LDRMEMRNEVDTKVSLNGLGRKRKERLAIHNASIVDENSGRAQLRPSSVSRSHQNHTENEIRLRTSCSTIPLTFWTAATLPISH